MKSWTVAEANHDIRMRCIEKTVEVLEGRIEELETKLESFEKRNNFKGE